MSRRCQKNRAENETEVEAKCSDARYSDLEEYFHFESLDLKDRTSRLILDRARVRFSKDSN